MLTSSSRLRSSRCDSQPTHRESIDLAREDSMLVHAAFVEFRMVARKHLLNIVSVSVSPRPPSRGGFSHATCSIRAPRSAYVQIGDGQTGIRTGNAPGPHYTCRPIAPTPKSCSGAANHVYASRPYEVGSFCRTRYR